MHDFYNLSCGFFNLVSVNLCTLKKMGEGEGQVGGKRYLCDSSIPEIQLIQLFYCSRNWSWNFDGLVPTAVVIQEAGGILKFIIGGKRQGKQVLM